MGRNQLAVGGVGTRGHPAPVAIQRLVEDRKCVQIEHAGHTGALGHLECVASEAEAGDVGHRVHLEAAKDVGGLRVQRRESFEAGLETRRRSALALGRIGAAARPAVPTLVRLLETETIEVRREIATALGMIGDPAPDVRTALERASRSDDRNLSRRAEVALRRLR